MMTQSQKRRLVRAVKREFKKSLKLTISGRHYNAGLRIRLVLKHLFFVRCDYLQDIQSCSNYWVWNHCKCRKRIDCPRCFLFYGFERSMWKKEEKEMESVVADRLKAAVMMLTEMCRYLSPEAGYCMWCNNGNKCPFDVDVCGQVSPEMWMTYLTKGGDYKISNRVVEIECDTE